MDYACSSSLGDPATNDSPLELLQGCPQVSQCHVAAAATVARLRRLLNATHASPDLATGTEAAIRLNISRQRRAAHAMYRALDRAASLEAPNADSATQLPPPAFSFTPMAGAPSCTLWGPPELSPCTAHRGTSASPGARQRPRSPAECPLAWNASTLLCDDPRPPMTSAAVGADQEGPRPVARAVPAADNRKLHAPRASLAGVCSFGGETLSRRCGGEGRAAVPLSERSKSMLNMASPHPATAPRALSEPAGGACSSSQQQRIDSERDQAIRDYLRRVNILSRDQSDCYTATSPFHDALFNGAALCQLVHCVVSDATPDLADPVPRRDPKTLEDVRLNYTAALSTLGDSGLTLPTAIFRITPEDVYRDARPSLLLDAYFHLIATHLPPLDELAMSEDASLLWQPPADDRAFQADLASPAGARRLREAELRSCRLLCAAGVLPDPLLCGIPPDECIVPGPLAAPHIAHALAHGAFPTRTEAPASLCLPSVLPFLSNGVALCSLAQRAAATAAGPSAAPQRNPRTRDGCLGNISRALRTVERLTRVPLPSSLTQDIFAGNRRSIVAVLDVLAGHFARAEAEMFPHPIADAGDLSGGSATPGAVAPLTGTRPATTADVAARRLRSGTQPEALDTSAPASAISGATAVRFTDKESEGLWSWLRAALGPGFQYRAEDDSFSVDSNDFPRTDPCLVFSDGVVLAHLIRVFECRRCDELECIRPTSKRPAKRFNVKRCLAFLQQEKGLVMPLPLLDEFLLAGDVTAVLSVAKLLRGKYRG